MLLSIAKLVIIYFVLFMRSNVGNGINPFDSYIKGNTEWIQCRDNANHTTEVAIQTRNQLFSLTGLSDGSVQIDFERVPEDHVLLTFSNDQSNIKAIESVNCWSATKDFLVIRNFTENETNTVCLMNKLERTVSPLDCLSFHPKMFFDQPIWLTQDDKPLFIGLLVMGLIICLVFGFGIGVLIIRRLSTKDQCIKDMISRPDLMTPSWMHDNKFRNCSLPYTEDDTISIASGKNYVSPVNPSQFDLIKMRIEKKENPTEYPQENQYDLEDMPYSKAPPPPENCRDSGISTGPIYAISSKMIDVNDSNGEDLYLCVDGDVNTENSKKFE